MREIIRQGLITLGLNQRVNARAAEHLTRYGLMLLEKNAVMNLTAITEPDDVARLHMLDCAALLGCCDLENKRALDVGTGAGFPGMVLKILVPSVDMTLLDSLNKRLLWLDEVSTILALRDIRTVHARAEEGAADPALRESFDVVTSRAVADLRMLCELCLPFVKVGGLFLAMKGESAADEVQEAQNALRQLGAQVERLYEYPVADAIHRVVVIRKTRPTPARYPRPFAKIKKAPL